MRNGGTWAVGNREWANGRPQTAGKLPRPSPYGEAGLLSGLLLALAAVGMALAQPEPAPVTVQVQVEPSEVTVGAVLALTVRVTAAPDVSLTLPEEEADFGDAEVRSLRKQQSREADGEQVVELVYELALFEVGKRQVRAPPIAYQVAGGDAQQAPRPAVSVTVESVLSEGAQDIRDIRGPRELPLSFWQWAGIGLAALALLGLVVAGIVAWRRLRRTEELEDVAPPAPPHVEALLALDELEAEDLVAQGRIKEHYIRLSWIVRRYLWRRYRVPALEETTGMLAGSLRACGRAPEEAQQFVSVLREADLVKFAKYVPQDARARQALDKARETVAATQPKEVPAEAADESAAAG